MVRERDERLGLSALMQRHLNDSRNRVTSRTDGLGASESYGWDGNSNLISHTDRRGKVMVLKPDALNRIWFAGYGQNGGGYESTINYTWDAGNRLTGELYVTSAGRRSVRRDSSLQQLSLRMTRGAARVFVSF